VVEGQGIEFMYQLYNPTLLKIEVLRLEKRLDDELYYLRYRYFIGYMIF
jgi:large subunit ribosomal protein L19